MWCCLVEQNPPSSCKSHICYFLRHHPFYHYATKQKGSTYYSSFLWLFESYRSREMPFCWFHAEKIASAVLLFYCFTFKEQNLIIIFLIMLQSKQGLLTAMASYEGYEAMVVTRHLIVYSLLRKYHIQFLSIYSV